MIFAKFCRLGVICLLFWGLTACVNQHSQIDVERSEAMKARINLALAYLEQNDFAKARENIDKAFAHDKHNYLPYAVEAYYYQQLDEIESAEKSYQKALQLAKNQPDVLNNYGTFLCKQGKFVQAYSLFEQALQSENYYHQADTLENVVLCAKQENNLEKLTPALQQLSALDPKRTQIVK